jgi:ABC-2 type transport system permease protein
LVGSPFLLIVTLKLFSARALFLWALGPSADAWLLGGLCAYATVLMVSTFAQNAFGYDGPGLRLLFAVPVVPSDVLRAKNVVHGAAGCLVSVCVALFYRVYAVRVSGWELVSVSLGTAAMVPFPVRFHADLRRRDRLPFAASMLGVAGAAAALALPGIIFRLHRSDGFEGRRVVELLCVLFAAWLFYAGSWPTVQTLLLKRRETILQTIERS